MQAPGNLRKRQDQQVNVVGGERPSSQRHEDEIFQVIVRTVRALRARIARLRRYAGYRRQLRFAITHRIERTIPKIRDLGNALDAGRDFLRFKDALPVRPHQGWDAELDGLIASLGKNSFAFLEDYGGEHVDVA